MTGLTIRPKVRESGPGSPRADVGEIDTRAPFQSVKAAVTLFGDVVSPKASSLPLKKSKAEERVLEKETQHQMLMRERGHYMNQARSAEAARAQAQRELQRDNATLRLLTNKLDALTQSKQASIKAAEDAKVRAKQLEEHRARRARLGDDAWKVDVNDERERYKVTTAQLVASKRELSILKQDLEAAEATKTALVQRAEEEEHRAQSNLERQSQLSKEVDEARAALDRVKHASHEAQQEHDRLMEEKEKSLMSYKSAKEEADKEIELLKQEYVPAEVLQEKLQQTMEAILVMQQKLQEIQSSDLYIVRKMAIDLNSAKKALEEAIAEEHSLHTAIDLFKHELKDVKKKIHESEKKAVKAEATVEKMQGHLDKKEAELEKVLSGSACAMLTSIEHHLAEAEKAKQEAEESKKMAELLKQEAEAARIATKEAEEKLNIALTEAEAAKAAEKLSEERVYNHSPTGEAADLQNSNKITLSVEEFESLNKKIEDFRNQADLKVAAATSEVEAINAREKGIAQQLEAMLKETEAIQSETEEALKRACNAEALTDHPVLNQTIH